MLTGKTHNAKRFDYESKASIRSMNRSRKSMSVILSNVIHFAPYYGASSKLTVLKAIHDTINEESMAALRSNNPAINARC